MMELNKKNLQALKDLYQIKEGTKKKNDFSTSLKKTSIEELKRRG